MKTISVTVEASDSFEKGDCYLCPFSTDGSSETDFIPMCPFWWREECPIEVVE